jgi:PTS system ascorbate-specific IIC component
LAIIGLVVFKSPVLVITGFVPVFFDNATFAVYANHKGGMKAAMIIPFISGVIQVIGGGLAAYIFQLSQFGGWHGNFDWDTLWLGYGVIMKYGGYAGVAALVIGMLLIPQIQYYKNKKHYFMIAEDYEQYKEEIEAENKAEFSTEAA